MRRGLRLLALLAVLAVPAPAAADALPGSASYGLSASNANWVPGDTVAERSKNYRRLYDAGVRAIRVELTWTYVEPHYGKPLGDYDFRGRDAEVEAIRRAGLKVIGILGYGHPDYSTRGGAVQQTPFGGGIPPFYVGNSSYTPADDPADFARYARATAEHYGDEVIGWEVWNEQNEGWRFWFPREDPPAYARMLCAAHGAVKQVDPKTPVAFGGVFFPAIAGQPGMAGPDFLQATYDADRDVGKCFDVMAYHPYPYPFTAPELDVPVRGSVLAAADVMRDVLARNGDGKKPLWITEVGWPTHDRTYGVSEKKQGQYTARMQAATFAQGLPLLTWYTYGDYDDGSGGNQEAWFGFFRPDGSPKPSYRALDTFNDVFEGTRFRSDRSRALGLPGGGLFTGGRAAALEYARREEGITAFWLANESVGEAQGQTPEGGTAGPEKLDVKVPVRADAVTVIDYLGAKRRVAARDGKVALEVGPGPQYLVDTARGTADLQRARDAALARRLKIGFHLHRRARRPCRRGGLRAHVSGRGARLIRRVQFYAGKRRAARDAGKPFTRPIAPRLLRQKGRRLRIRARVTMKTGRRLTLSRRTLTCHRR